MGRMWYFLWGENRIVGHLDELDRMLRVGRGWDWRVFDGLISWVRDQYFVVDWERSWIARFLVLRLAC